MVLWSLPNGSNGHWPGLRLSPSHRARAGCGPEAQSREFAHPVTWCNTYIWLNMYIEYIYIYYIYNVCVCMCIYIYNYLILYYRMHVFVFNHLLTAPKVGRWPAWKVLYFSPCPVAPSSSKNLTASSVLLRPFLDLYLGGNCGKAGFSLERPRFKTPN